MNRVLAPTCVSQLRTAFAVISAPLSDRMCSGTPRMSMTSAMVSRTPKLLIRRATLMARHSRVNPSISVISRSLWPASKIINPSRNQAYRSRHHKIFLEPHAGPLLLADGALRLRERLAKSGVPASAIEQDISVLGNEPTMEVALAWYWARGAIRAPLGAISVPVLYVWGDADDTVGHAAAEGTREFVSGPYQFEILSGISHFAADQAPDQINELLLTHLAKYPV
jgi:pimeloyl-ACP methyl ester carboxylesterase